MFGIDDCKKSVGMLDQESYDVIFGVGMSSQCDI